MIKNISVFDLIIILGAIQGMIFCAYLWFKPLKNKKANLYLSLFIFSFAASSIYYTLETIGVRGFLNIWDFSPLFCPILIVTSFYLFVRALVQPNAKINVLGYILITFSLAQFLFQLWGTCLILIDHDRVLELQHFIFSVYNFNDYIILILGFVVLGMVIWEIRNYNNALLKNYAEISDFSLDWLTRLFIFLIGIWILFALPVVYELITGYAPFNIYYPMWISTSVLIYWIGYSTYFRRTATVPETYHTEKYERDNKLSENTVEYHNRLKLLMTQDKVYLNQELNLKILAEKLDLSSGYLSQIINKYEDKNFFEYINGYRVEEVKSRIGKPEHSHLNLLGIALDCGFKSKSTFNLAFKKHTGMTPTAFKKSR